VTPAKHSRPQERFPQPRLGGPGAPTQRKRFTAPRGGGERCPKPEGIPGRDPTFSQFSPARPPHGSARAGPCGNLSFQPSGRSSSRRNTECKCRYCGDGGSLAANRLPSRTALSLTKVFSIWLVYVEQEIAQRVSLPQLMILWMNIVAP